MSPGGRISFALIAALATPLVGAAGCGGRPGGADQVSAVDFRFDPARLEVAPGNTVTWRNRGQTAHNVKGPGFGTGRVLDPGQTYSHRFTRPGTYRYLCTLHPTQMKGTVVIR